MPTPQEACEGGKYQRVEESLVRRIKPELGEVDERDGEGEGEGDGGSYGGEDTELCGSNETTRS